MFIFTLSIFLPSQGKLCYWYTCRSFLGKNWLQQTNLLGPLIHDLKQFWIYSRFTFVKIFKFSIFPCTSFFALGEYAQFHSPETVPDKYEWAGRHWENSLWRDTSFKRRYLGQQLDQKMGIHFYIALALQKRLILHVTKYTEGALDSTISTNMILYLRHI